MDQLHEQFKKHEEEIKTLLREEALNWHFIIHNKRNQPVIARYPIISQIEEKQGYVSIPILIMMGTRHTIAFQTLPTNSFLKRIALRNRQLINRLTEIGYL